MRVQLAGLVLATAAAGVDPVRIGWGRRRVLRSEGQIPGGQGGWGGVPHAYPAGRSVFVRATGE